LSAKGPGPVTASKFELPSDVKIANPDLVIANLADKNAKLEIEATVESGFGYSPAEDRKSTAIGVIPLDAVFTPVSRVNYTVEATRVGRLTNYDRLVLDVTTDGTVAPKDALTAAAQVLVDYFSAVVNPDQDTLSDSSLSTPSSSSSTGQPGSAISIEELDLPTRIGNALQKAGFEAVADLLAVPRGELAKIKNLGIKSVKIVELALNQRGYQLTA
jgi:DNA-directed RNA polymerase subunit alpha